MIKSTNLKTGYICKSSVIRLNVPRYCNFYPVNTASLVLCSWITMKLTSYMGKKQQGKHWHNTCLQLVRKTRIFDLRFALMKLHNVLNFWSSGTITANWVSCSGVAVTDSSCTLMYSGFFKLSLARSLTDLVCVAENSRVCLCLGRWEMMASSSFLKPASRILSASSRTKICPIRKIKL